MLKFLCLSSSWRYFYGHNDLSRNWLEFRLCWRDENGTVYRGTGWSSSEVGEYKDGTIYRGCGLHSDAIGEYKNGTIYTGLGLHSREIGEYKDGTIYRGTGWSSTPIGEYKDGSDGVAAAALLLLAADLL